MKGLLALLMLVAACCLASGLLNTTSPVVAVSNSVVGTGGVACQPQNPLLNTLLLQLLLSSLQQTTQQQQQQAAFFNQFVNPTPPLLTPRTTLITSSLIRTVTDFVSTPVAFWLRNQRITSTLVSSTTRQVTELVIITSTLDNLLVRNKRQAELEDSYNETADLNRQDEEMEARLKSVLKKPAVQEAWRRFYNLLVEELNN